MDELVKAIFGLIGNQCGLTTLILILIIIYQTWQLNLERKGREHDRHTYLSEVNKIINYLLITQDELHFHISNMTKKTRKGYEEP